MFFHYNAIRNYTGALLSLFGNVETKVDEVFQQIPIQYSNKERSAILNELNFGQITQNTQVLPRMMLLFNGISFNREREHSKFIKFKIDNKQYQYNSIPCDFSFSVVAQARGMNEASMIIEQVMSYFNPSYNMKIRELPLPGIDYTSVILTCDSVDIEQQDTSDAQSLNVVTITFGLNVRGNLYPVIRDTALIEKIQIFLSTSNFTDSDNDGYKDTENIDRVKSLYYNQKTDEAFQDKYYCKIIDVLKTENGVKCIYDSPCEKLIKFTFEWNINGKQLIQSDQELNYQFKDGDNIKVRMFSDIVSSEVFETTYEK